LKKYVVNMNSENGYMELEMKLSDSTCVLSNVTNKQTKSTQ